MKVYICPCGINEKTLSTHQDREQFFRIAEKFASAGTGKYSQWGWNMDSIEEADSIQHCDLYVALSGMYLTYGYKEAIEEQLETARTLQKHILVVRPHGTGYVPLKLRPYAEIVSDITPPELVQVLSALIG